MRTKIIHFSDTHESMSLESKRGYFDKRFFAMLNSRFLRKKRHHQQLLDHAVEMMLAEKPDIIVFTGDATTCGQPSEFHSTLQRLSPLLKSDIPIIYTPGNHDSYVRDEICLNALKEFYKSIFRDARELSSEPFICELNGLRFIAVHCARPTLLWSSCGHMKRPVVDYLQNAVSEKNNSQIILCGHFPVLERRPIRQMRRRLYGASKVAKMIHSKQIELSLCGHVHKPYELLDFNGYGEMCAGSLTRYALFSVIEHNSATGTFSSRHVSIS